MRLLLLSLFLAGTTIAWERSEPSSQERHFDDECLKSTTGCIFILLDQQGYAAPSFGESYRFCDYFDAVAAEGRPQLYDIAKFTGSDGNGHGGLIVSVDPSNKQVTIKSPVGIAGGEVISIWTTLDYKDIDWLMRPHLKQLPGGI